MEISPYAPNENLATILQPALEIDEKVSLNVRRRTTRVRSPAEKPWTTKKKSITERIAQILPFVGSVIGILLTAYYVYAGYTAVPNHKYCLVLEDNFQALDTTIWSAEKVLGGYRNGDFQYYSDDVENLYVQNNQLHIVPTINEIVQTQGNVLNITEQGCTSIFTKDCWAAVNGTLDTIINPVKSARISTKMSKSIKYGRLEVRAKMPQGDWLWPSISMLPAENVYGSFPKSGEIDVVESRGNAKLKKGGTKSVVSTLRWGPSDDTDQFWRSRATRTMKRSSFADAYHVFGLEWSEKYIYTFIDSRLSQILYRPTTKSFWEQGGFDGSDIINPWVAHSPNAPFDQSFYLSLGVAVGGNSGFFDETLTKPWQNTQNSTSAMKSFWDGRDQWQASWPRGR